METYSWKNLWKIGIFSLVFGVLSTILTYGVVAGIEWIQEGGITELKNKIEARKEEKKNSKYVTKTLGTQE